MERSFVMLALWMAAACAAAATAVGAAETRPAEARMEPDVERRIAEGIEKHRKGDFVVRVVDGRGRPVPNAQVRVEMTRHAFGFGTAVNAGQLIGKGDHPDTRTYKEWIPKLFNQATLENGHKWYSQANPDSRAQADAATDWLLDQGLKVHAHAMIWASMRWKPMPRHVIEKITGDDPNRATTLREATLEHIADVGRRYRGRAVSWDVVNEPYSERAIQKIVNPDAPRGQEPILVAWFGAARAAAPDATLFVNDFHILVKDDQAHKDSYEGTIRYLLEQGAPLGGIGFQGHYHNGNHVRTPRQLLETLDRFGRFGLEMAISEFDTFGRNWGETRDEREQRHAQYLRDVLRTFFSHPQARSFTMWGFWDGRHWSNTAPLFRKDWTPKPALAVWWELVFGAWWTETTGRTGDDGRMSLRGFYGDYRVVVTAGGRTIRRDVALRQNGCEATVELSSE